MVKEMLTTSPGLIFAVFKCVISMSWKNADVLIESVQYVLTQSAKHVRIRNSICSKGNLFS